MDVDELCNGQRYQELPHPRIDPQNLRRGQEERIVISKERVYALQDADGAVGVLVLNRDIRQNSMC